MNKFLYVGCGNHRLIGFTHVEIDFSKTYSANGYIDLYRKKFILKNKKLFGNKVMGYITPLTMEIDSKAELDYMNFNENN